MMVEVDGKLGIITSSNCLGNLNIRFGDKKFSVNFYPQWRTTYFDKDGNVIADYTKK